MNGNEVYSNLYQLCLPEDRVECDCTLIIIIDSLFVNDG